MGFSSIYAPRFLPIATVDGDEFERVALNGELMEVMGFV